MLILFSDLKLKKNIPYCRDHARRLSKVGLFPEPVALSNRRIAFVEAEIDAWIAEKIAARDERRDSRRDYHGDAPRAGCIGQVAGAGKLQRELVATPDSATRPQGVGPNRAGTDPVQRRKFRETSASPTTPR
jgi:prophage regulatory protein